MKRRDYKQLMQQKKRNKNYAKMAILGALGLGVGLANSDVVNAEEWIPNTTTSIQKGDTQYTIKWGDYLDLISKDSGLTIDTLMRLNDNIVDANLIYAGNVISFGDGTDVVAKDSSGNVIASMELTEADKVGIKEAQSSNNTDTTSNNNTTNTNTNSNNTTTTNTNKPSTPNNNNENTGNGNTDTEKPSYESTHEDKYVTVNVDTDGNVLASTDGYDYVSESIDNGVTTTAENGDTVTTYTTTVVWKLSSNTGDGELGNVEDDYINEGGYAIGLVNGQYFSQGIGNTGIVADSLYQLQVESFQYMSDNGLSGNLGTWEVYEIATGKIRYSSSVLDWTE